MGYFFEVGWFLIIDKIILISFLFWMRLIFFWIFCKWRVNIFVCFWVGMFNLCLICLCLVLVIGLLRYICVFFNEWWLSCCLSVSIFGILCWYMNISEYIWWNMWGWGVIRFLFLNVSWWNLYVVFWGLFEL